MAADLDIFDVKSFLQENGCKILDTGDYYRIRAIWRGGDGFNVSINKKTGKWTDFVTSESGEFKNLSKLINGESVEGNFLSVEAAAEIQITKKFSKEILESLVRDHSYWENRAVDPKIFNQIDAGLLNLPKLENRHVTVIYDESGGIAGLAGRSLDPKTRIKWKILGNKKKFCFPFYLNRAEIKNNEIILVESLGNLFSLLTAGINTGVVMFGSYLSPVLLSKIIGLNPRIIKIATDYDENGAGQRSADSIRNKFLHFFDDPVIKIIEPTYKKEKFNDLNEMLVKCGPESLQEIFEK